MGSTATIRWIDVREPGRVASEGVHIRFPSQHDGLTLRLLDDELRWRCCVANPVPVAGPRCDGVVSRWTLGSRRCIQDALNLAGPHCLLARSHDPGRLTSTGIRATATPTQFLVGPLGYRRSIVLKWRTLKNFCTCTPAFWYNGNELARARGKRQNRVHDASFCQCEYQEAMALMDRSFRTGRKQT
jgi:hypothetical protein